MNTMVGTVAIALVVLTAVLLAELVGSLWIWTGTILGVIYIFSGSVLLAGWLPAATEWMQSVCAFFVQEVPGPLTGLFRNAFPETFPVIFTTYRETIEMLWQTESYSSEMLEPITRVWGQSIYLPLAAGIYCNAELLAGLFAVNIPLKILKHRRRSRKLEARRQKMAEKRAENRGDLQNGNRAEVFN